MLVLCTEARPTCRCASNSGIVVVGDNDSGIAGWLYVQQQDLPVDVLVTAGLLLLVTMTVTLLVGKMVVEGEKVVPKK